MKFQRDSRLGKYVIRERIGVGGMGAVYRAQDSVLVGRHVAIKTLHPDKSKDPEYLARFRREAEAMSLIEHPRIVSLKEYVEGDPENGEPPYMVMELLEGEDLQKIVARGPLATERAVDILLQTCLAVATCHQQGLIHRDLKGTNIFITQYDSAEVVKILDFGVVKTWGESVLPEGVDPAEATRKGVAVGTPEYLAPEVLRGASVSPAADQYALGIVLYSALTGGRKPFEAAKKSEYRDVQLLHAILKGDHVRARVHRPEIPEGLDAVIERAISNDPKDRFPSVHALGEALLPWASEEARVQWTRHFTTPQRPIVKRSMIVKLAPEAGQREPTELDTGEPPGGTAADPDRPLRRPASSITRPAPSGEMRDLLAAAVLEGPVPAARAPIATGPTRREKPLHSISVDIVEASAGAIPELRQPPLAVPPNVFPVAAAIGAAAAPRRPRSEDELPAARTGPRRQGRSSFRTGVGIVMGAAVVFALLMMRGVIHVPGAPASQDRPSASPTQPATIIPPAPTAAQTTTSHDPPPLAPAPPEPTHEASKTPSTSAEARREDHPKRPKTKRHPTPMVDENGIGIPAN